MSVFLAAEGVAEEYATAAGKLQMSTGAAAVAVHRMRVRYRERIGAEVADTVLLPGEADDEMRYLSRCDASNTPKLDKRQDWGD